MADQISNYQCPSCMGPLHYDGKSGRLKCEYCGSDFSVQEIEALYKEKDEAAAAASAQAEILEDQFSAEGEWSVSGTNWAKEPGLKAYNCPSCGAELVCDETTAATACPYCGNPSIVPGQLSDMLKPDYVIPFKLSKEEAVAALKKYYIGKRLLPKEFSDKNHIEEIKGVYVPFWLFDGAADADMQFQGTRVSSVTTGNTIVTTTGAGGVQPPRRRARGQYRGRYGGPDRGRLFQHRPPGQADPHPPRQGEICPAAGVDALHPLERRELSVRHERADRQAHRRPAGGKIPGRRLVCGRGRRRHGADGPVPVFPVRRGCA